MPRPKKPDRPRVANCFAFGLAEHGRLGIGPPDDERMMQESGSVVGWHQPEDPAERLDVKVTNVRSRRTHVRGLARLAKLPHTVPEAAVGSTGGVVLPTTVVGRPFRAKAPRIVDVATGATHSLAVSEDGHVYGWGSGAFGQLGFAVIQDKLAELEVERLARQKRMSSTVSAAPVATVETTLVECNVWEPHPQPPLPQPKQKVAPGEFAEEYPPDPVAKVFCSSRASLCLTAGGKVWGWGDGSYNVLGQTAQGQADPGEPKPLESPLTEMGCKSSSLPLMVRGPVERQTVTQLACGSYHVLALTLANKVLAWGRNDDGQLGIGRKSTYETPRQVKLNSTKEPCYCVAAGDRHSLAVVKVTRVDGRTERTCFAWGSSANGRLGGVGDKRTSEPQEVASLGRIYKKYRLTGYLKKVYCGRDHSVALTDSERVITWGAGSYGQLGNGFGFDSELPSLVDGIYNVVQVACGDKHTLALCWCAPRRRPPPIDDQLDEDDKLEAQEERLKSEVAFDPFGKDDPTTMEATFVLDKQGRKTSTQVVPRANELFGWGWNGFGELGTGDELPRLSPVLVESVLPASCAKVAAGSHHTLMVTSGYAVTCREDGQRPFKGYAQHVKAYEEVYAAEVASDEQRLQRLGFNADDDTTINSGGGESGAAGEGDDDDDGGGGNGGEGGGGGGSGRPSTTVGPGGRPKLSKIGELALQAASNPLRRAMEFARLNAKLLESPAALVPDQIGLEPATVGSSAHHASHSEGGGGGGGDDASLGGSTVGNGSPREAHGVDGEGHKKEGSGKAAGTVPRFVRKFHPQEAVAPRDFSLGAYCLDTPEPHSDMDRWPPLRGSYQAVYKCPICKLTQICLVCARHCHASHAVSVHLVRQTDLRNGGACDCGVPLPPPKPKKRYQMGPAEQRAFDSATKSAARAAALGMKPYVNRCRCQSTPERRIFDKHIDPLDGRIRARQLATVLKEMHDTAQQAKIDAAMGGGKKKPPKWVVFDEEDALQAEDTLGGMVNYKPPATDDDDEVDFDPVAGDGGIDWFMFIDWKVKYEEQKKSRAAMQAVSSSDEEDDEDD